MYTIPLPPTGTNNAYHTGNGHWYKDAKVHRWEEDCLWKLKGKIEVTEGWVELDITFFDCDHRRRDIDGRVKSVLDLFQKAGLYLDDKFVVDCYLHKRYDKDNPRVEIKVIWPKPSP